MIAPGSLMVCLRPLAVSHGDERLLTRSLVLLSWRPKCLRGRRQPWETQSLRCVPFVLGGRNFRVPSRKFPRKLKSDFQLGKSDESHNVDLEIQDGCSVHQQSVKAVLYTVFSTSVYLCVIKSVVHTVLSNFYVWTSVCMCKTPRNTWLSTGKTWRPSWFLQLFTTSFPVLTYDFWGKWNAPLNSVCVCVCTTAGDRQPNIRFRPSMTHTLMMIIHDEVILSYVLVLLGVDLQPCVLHTITSIHFIQTKTE